MLGGTCECESWIENFVIRQSFINKNVDHPVLKIVFVGYFKIFILTFDFIY